jgi:hypothetical protein
MILRGRWCDITVLNVGAPTENKSHDTNDFIYEGLSRIFDQFQGYYNLLIANKTF